MGDQDPIEAPGHRVFVPGQGAVTSGGPASGVETFLELTDTPSSFTAGKYYRVNSGGTAIEEVDLGVADRLLEKHVIHVELSDWEWLAAGGTTNLVGTGAVTHIPLRPMRISTGTTNPSSAQVYWQLPVNTNNAGLLSQINWDTDFEIILIWSDDRAGSAGNRFTNWKISVTTTLGVLAGKGIGFRINRNSTDYDVSTHNGGTIQTTTITKPSTTSLWRFHVKHFGSAADPRTEFWHDGVLQATHTASDNSPSRVPSGTSSPHHQFEVQGIGVDLDADFSQYIIVQDWV